MYFVLDQEVIKKKVENERVIEKKKEEERMIKTRRKGKDVKNRKSRRE